jgi:hypothetical protein
VSKVSLTYHRKGLASRVASLRVLAIIPYSAYALSNSLYRFATQSLKCVKCIRRVIPYDENFSEADFDRLKAEKRRLKEAL